MKITSSNLGHFILGATDAYRERPAFILKDQMGGSRRPLSFFEFNETVLKISQTLREHWSLPGFKIGLWGENRVEWCALAIAVWHAGGTVVPLMHIATDAEVKNIVKAAKIDAIFISPQLGHKESLDVKEVYSMDFAPGRGRNSLKSLGDLLSERRNLSGKPSAKIDEQNKFFNPLAVLIFTSGTTGHPKGVMLSHENIITDILNVMDAFPIGKDDRAVSLLPLSHMFELVAGFTICHMKGICISYPDSLKPDDVLKEMQLHKATMLVAVPLFFEIIDRAIQDKIQKLSPFVQKTLSSLGGCVEKAPFLGKIFFKKVHSLFGGNIRFFFTGGAKIDPEIILRFKHLGIDFLQGYGLTETSPIISFTPLRNEKYTSVGRPIPSVKIKIFEPNDNGEGEICVSGPTVFSGYFENQAATAEVIKDGWFHTGDIGRLDQDNFIFITGRKKDIIVTPNGKNVYPEEIEELLKTSSLIEEAAVIGLDTGRGEEVHAVIRPSSSTPTDKATKHQVIWTEVERLCENLSEYKRIKGLTLAFEELPKTATKKIKKHVLREMVLQGRLSRGVSAGSANEGPHTPLDSEQERETWLKEKIIQITKKNEVWKEASLRQDLSIDSLTFMELVSAVEGHWGVQIHDEDFEKILTVSDLLTRLTNSSAVLTEKTPVKKFDYRINNRFFMKTLRLIVHGIFIRPILHTLFRFRVFNSEIFRNTKNWIITPNHTSHLDLLSILSSIPLHQLNSTYAVAADDYFFDRPVKAYIVRLLFNAIPFERRARIDKGFVVCENILKEGRNLIIFPEGTRSPTGQLSSFKPGVGRLLASQAYSAIPVYINGAAQAMPKGSFLPKPHALSVYVGKPIKFTSQPSDLAGYQFVATELYGAVEDLRFRSLLSVRP